MSSSNNRTLTATSIIHQNHPVSPSFHQSLNTPLTFLARPLVSACLWVNIAPKSMLLSSSLASQCCDSKPIQISSAAWATPVLLEPDGRDYSVLRQQLKGRLRAVTGASIAHFCFALHLASDSEQQDRSMSLRSVSGKFKEVPSMPSFIVCCLFLSRTEELFRGSHKLIGCSTFCSEVDSGPEPMAISLPSESLPFIDREDSCLNSVEDFRGQLRFLSFS